MKFPQFPALIASALFYAGAIIFVYTCSDHFLFWDTVHFGGKIGSWYFENNLKIIGLPTDLDNGHFPIFGYYLAAVWKLFGKSVVASHWAMLPFILGIVWQTQSVIKHIISLDNRGIALFVLIADATLLSQCSLISPDIILVFAFLGCLNGLLQQRAKWTIIFSLLLVVISNRGIIVMSALLIWQLIENPNDKTKAIKYFAPAIVLVVLLQCWHYFETGWIGYNRSFPWAESFHFVPLKEVIYNLGIATWRILDFGRVFIWLGIIGLLAKDYPRLAKDIGVRSLFKLLCILIIFLVGPTIIFSNLIGHRYYLPIYLIAALLFALLFDTSGMKDKFKRPLGIIVLVGLLTGNCWIYPDNISQGWDASLAHLPYYNLQEEMIAYLDKEEIPFAEVGSAFNNLNPLKYIDLSERTDRMKSKDIDKDRYILYSNVWNEFSDAELAELGDLDMWRVRKEFRGQGIRVTLYENVRDLNLK